MKKVISIFIFVLFLISCKSTDMFLLSSFDDSEKAKILSEKGIAAYKKNIEQNQDLNSIEKVKIYFLKALEYDKNNSTATEYILKLVNFRDDYLNKIYKTISILKDRKDKKDSDEFAMCSGVERLLVLDPKNKNYQKLKTELKPTYDKIIKLYTEKAAEVVKKSEGIKDNNKKEKSLMEALDYYKKILAIDQKNFTAKKGKEDFEKTYIVKIKNLISEIDKKIQQKQFDKAASSFDLLDSYNRQIDLKYITEIKDLEFRNYYNWALELNSKNKTGQAVNVLNKAISIKKDNDAIRLRNKLQSSQKDVDLTKSLDATLNEIDELINNDDLIGAKNKIDSLMSYAKTADQKDKLNGKLSLIKEKIPSIYDSAVGDYNAEKFKDAIKKFGIIIKIDPNFKDAKSYYDKANEKQKLIDKY